MSDIKLPLIPVEFFGGPADGKRGHLPKDLDEYEIYITANGKTIARYLYRIEYLMDMGFYRVQFIQELK